MEADLFTHLAIHQTKLFLGHLRNCDETGDMLLNKLEYTQQISGLLHPILLKQTLEKFLVWTPKTWISDFKKVLHAFGGEVRINNVWVPTLQRTHDISLIDYFSHQINDADTLKIINNCRIYLQIFTLADMTSADGTKLQNAFSPGSPIQQ